jgi:dTDP-4-amino-4,6-dideoxygalactose transaminase
MAITKEASDTGVNNLPVCYTPSARDAFRRILKQLNFSNSEYILLPAYVGITDKEGSGVFDPVRGLGLKYDFYKVDNKLEFDYKDIEKNIKEKKVKALLVIHYFGFLRKGMGKLRQLCNKEKIILIEDCAHAMDSFYHKRAYTNIGKTGDFSFYSIHKYLPTKDGGFYTYKSDFNLNPDVDGGGNISYETLFRAHMADYDKIRNKRIANYKYMLGMLQKTSKYYSILYPNLPKGVVPLNLPVIIHNKNREKLYFKLIDKKVMVIALYYRMIEQIDKNKFPVSYAISESILNFPTHQDIEKTDIKYMIDSFNNVLLEL